MLCVLTVFVVFRGCSKNMSLMTRRLLFMFMFLIYLFKEGIVQIA